MEKKFDCNLIAKKLRGNKSFSYFGKPIDKGEWKNDWKEQLEEVANLEKKIFEYCLKDEKLYKIFINRVLILIEEIEKDLAYFNPKYVDIDSYIMYLEGEMITDNFLNDHRYYYDEKGKKRHYMFVDDRETLKKIHNIK